MLSNKCQTCHKLYDPDIQFVLCPHEQRPRVRNTIDDNDDRPKPHDPVNHPSHYTSHPSGVECIDITRHMTFNLGNAFKYIWRNGLKTQTTAKQDLQKAIWYIEDEIKRLDKESSKTRDPRRTS